MAEITPLEIVQQAQPSLVATRNAAQLVQSMEERCAFAIPGDAGDRRNEDFHGRSKASRLECQFPRTGHGPPEDSVRVS
jgi:hypothetical protein